MKEYEIVLKFSNACGGDAHAQTTFDEAVLSNPDDYIRLKHTKEHEKFVRENLPDGRILYTYDNGSVCYRYELTEI